MIYSWGTPRIGDLKHIENFIAAWAARYQITSCDTDISPTLKVKVLQDGMQPDDIAVYI